MKTSLPTVLRTTLTVAAISTFACASTGIAAAAEPSQSMKDSTYDTISASSEVVAIADIDQLAQDLETLFTEYIPMRDGRYFVNETQVIQAGYGDQIQNFHQVAAMLNSSQEVFGTGVTAQRFDDFGSVPMFNGSGFAKCVVAGALGIPTTAFNYATWMSIQTAIKAYNWGLAASTAARALGPAFVGGFGKAIGGPAMIAAAFATAAGACAITNW